MGCFIIATELYPQTRNILKKGYFFGFRFRGCLLQFFGDRVGGSLVPGPHYSAQPNCFGSRGPRLGDWLVRVLEY